jgi:hypothetical protein
VALDDLTYCLPHPIPAAITAKRHTDLLGKQMLKPGRGKPHVGSQCDDRGQVVALLE